MDTVIVILLSLCIILLIILLVRSSSKNQGTAVTDEKIDSLAKNTAMSFAEARRENTSSSEDFKNAVTGAIDKLSEKNERLAERMTDIQNENTKFMAQTREKIDELGKEQTKTISESLEKILLSNEKKLDEMRTTVDEKLTSTLTTRLDSSFSKVSEQLTNVYKSLGEMKDLSDSVTSLNRAFTNVKIRGNWAESQLEGILDEIIPGMYIKNFRPDESRDSVEFAVVIPSPDGNGQTYLPIDSKFPIEDYIKLTDAADMGDQEGVKTARKNLESRILNEAKSISKYINPPVTTPFAVMYLATDALYAEVISHGSIIDKIHSDYNVLIAGPSTVTALLSSLAIGFRSVALNQKAAEVMEILSAAKTQYDKFTEALEKAKKKITEAGQSLEDAQKRNAQINKKLKNVETVDSAKAELLLSSDT